MSQNNDGWRFMMDRGGTFTDVVIQKPDGQLSHRKYLSDNPQQYDDAVSHVLSLYQPQWQNQNVEVRLGTTVATNALLQHNGARTALVTTEGFADILDIGDQSRPELFARKIEKHFNPCEAVIEVIERLDQKGKILTELDTHHAQQQLDALKAAGIESLAICLLHAWKNPVHENLLAEMAERTGFRNISVSSRLNPTIHFLKRCESTVVDAYLSPVLRRYTKKLEQRFPMCRFRFMQSHGGLCNGEHFSGLRAVLSGPAGGIAAMAGLAEASGQGKWIGFDMGGTSTDVSLFNGRPGENDEAVFANCRIRTPMLEIHTVAAGGGSIIHYDGERLRVGPESAGAMPGPVCYGLGQKLTVSDANLLLGRIQANDFPHIFGQNSDEPLNTVATRKAFSDLLERVPHFNSIESLAEASLEVAAYNMANAVKEISVRKGEDPSSYALFCFGGAAGQMACQVAEILDMDQVTIPPMNSVLSALGMGLADESQLLENGVGKPLESVSDRELAELLEQQLREACQRIPGAKPEVLHQEARLELGFPDTSVSIWLDYSTTGDIQVKFQQAYRLQFGFNPEAKPLYLKRIRSRIRLTSAFKLDALSKEKPEASHNGSSQVYINGTFQTIPNISRDSLQAGDQLIGPARLVDPHSTLFIKPGWTLNVSSNGILHLKHTENRHKSPEELNANPALLEVFNHLFMHVARQMGNVLQATAHSVNIRERLDFSCAIFDQQGRLVANAPHMPVHLGSMSETVHDLVTNNAHELKADTAFISNDPYHGGTHLPDLTVTTPVFNSSGKLQFFVASRAHHADIGGISPGSMPADSKCLADEGIVFRNFRLTSEGVFHEEKLRNALASGKWPARNPDHNIADIKAQLAANERGIQELYRLLAQFSEEQLIAYMGHVRDNARRAVERMLKCLPAGRQELALDQGHSISVVITKTTDRLTLDFSASSAQGKDNFNAPKAVSVAAVLYTLRLLLDDEIPLNAGCLEPVNIILADNNLLNPGPPAAVVAGNVETSQVLCDTLMMATHTMAASQGTMNNITFGNQKFQYYETVCGGTGAGPDFPGTDAVHSHMTNSRLTDVELFESRFPVRIRRFQVRPHSGGKGKYNGGNGVIREYEFLEDVEFSLLSGRRSIAPPGLDGGSSALAGETHVIRLNGDIYTLHACEQLHLKAGERVLLKTPGGGGYGDA